MLSNEVYFCYDLNKANYLRNVCKLDCYTVAKHLKTDRVFTLFKQDDQLTKGIEAYKRLHT